MSAIPRVPRHSRLRRLFKPMVSPAVFDFWASRVNPTWSWERPLARIVGREPAGAEAVTLRLAPNRHCAGVLPGQHLNIGADVQGVRLTRSYSPTSLPGADGAFSITVKRVAGGRLSQHLCDHAQVGDVLEVGAAFGHMRLPVTLEGQWLFLAAGSGITPLMAMTREMAARGMPVPLTLMYWARTREALCFVDELRALAAKYPQFKLHLILTGQTPQAADEAQGRIDQALLDSLSVQPQGQQVMACGPGGFVDAARALMATQARGFQAEAFSLPPQQYPDTGNVQVRLLRSGVNLRLPRGQSLLQALEAEGIKPDAGCRMGICNTCACGKSAGTTRHLPSGQLDHDATTALKLCISSAVSDLELDL